MQISGLARLEIADVVGFDVARSLADAVTVLLPQFVPSRGRDPRAPQNLLRRGGVRFPAVFQTPFTLMRRLNDEVERMFWDFGFRRPAAFLTPEVPVFDWVPAIEVFEKDQKLFVRAELPGLRRRRSGSK